MTRKEKFNEERGLYLGAGLFNGTCPFTENKQCSQYNWKHCSRCPSYIGSIEKTSVRNPMLCMSKADFTLATQEFYVEDGSVQMCPFSMLDQECADLSYTACKSCIHMFTDSNS